MSPEDMKRLGIAKIRSEHKTFTPTKVRGVKHNLHRRNGAEGIYNEKTGKIDWEFEGKSEES